MQKKKKLTASNNAKEMDQLELLEDEKFKNQYKEILIFYYKIKHIAIIRFNTMLISIYPKSLKSMFSLKFAHLCL